MRNSFYTIAVVVSFALLTTGCAGIGTKTFKKFKVEEGTSLSIDATQRVILVSESANGRKVCAEPSPDAMVAAAAQAALKGDVAGQGGGELSGGFSQGASSIGIRTATIQLLRDGYFRACEASMNGLLDREEYQGILEGIGPVMTGLVALDGLTQMKPAPVVSIGGIGSASTTKDVTAVDNKVEVHVDKGATPTPFDVSTVADHVVQVVKEVNRALKELRQEQRTARASDAASGK